MRDFYGWLNEGRMRKVVTRSGVEMTYESPGTESRAKKMLGQFNADDLADLVGAFEGCTISLGPLGFSELMFVVNGPKGSFRANRRLKQDWDDKSLYMSNDDLHAPEWARGQKIGARLLTVQAAAARRLGVKVIKTHAERGGGNYGYYSMARMGYDAALPDDVKSALPADFQGVGNLQDLMSTPQGRAWWKQNGKAMNMTFDPSEESPSSRTLRNYTR